MEEERKEPSGGKQVLGCIWGFVKALLIMAAVLAVIVGIFLAALLYQPKYNWFGFGRKAKMEEIFGITVTDDMTLVHYSEFTFLTQIDITLDLTVPDYEKFLAENLNGEAVFKWEKEHEICYIRGNDDDYWITVYLPPEDGQYHIELCITD